MHRCFRKNEQRKDSQRWVEDPDARAEEQKRMRIAQRVLGAEQNAQQTQPSDDENPTPQVEATVRKRKRQRNRAQRYRLGKRSRDAERARRQGETASTEGPVDRAIDGHHRGGSSDEDRGDLDEDDEEPDFSRGTDSDSGTGGSNQPF